jgi:protein-disulfide isomerase
MKRFAPFLIIGLVAVLTLVGATLLLRANARARAAHPASSGSGLAGVDLGHARGPVDAPVLLEEFGDFQCPACAETSVSIRGLEQEYHDRLRMVFYEFPLDMHAHARTAAAAAEAASAQGHFWEMHDLLYEHQKTWAEADDTRAELERLALQLHLNIANFHRAMLDSATAVEITRQQAYGVSRGVKNTPTLFFNGRECQPPFSPEHLREAFAAALVAGNKS